ncbi:unnamed protein product, partial [Choristocarpus tenellus]
KCGERPRTAVVTGTVIELEASPCALARIDRQILVATTDNMLHSFHFKGKRNYTMKMNTLVTNLEVLTTRSTTCLLVALSNGDIKLYNDKNLIHTLKTGEAVQAMRVGSFAREESTLVVVSTSGKLSIFMLNRKADMKGTSGDNTLPAEQDIPLMMPKKTKLFVEQAQRERNQAGDIHRAFQRDLCRLRLLAARSYVKAITCGNSGISPVGTAALRLHAECRGL